MNKDLWRFDYNQGVAYEEFSRCQDAFGIIDGYLSSQYDFKGKTILEVGAGSGKFTSFLSRECSKLYVVERSTSLMQINRDKNLGANNVEFMLTDARDLIILPSSVDLIFAGWSLTSMRDSFDIVFRKLGDILRADGMILAIENAGNDEFCELLGINEFTEGMRSTYADLGFFSRTVVGTVIRLPRKGVFYNAFPGKWNVKLPSLDIQHNVSVLEMTASVLQHQKG
ncbi:MAG: methyltransferase domain-containing protein [bacterium]|nr:methyltransferase domain-containing protein [bacterium]